MSRRFNRLSAQLGVFVKQYAKKAQKGIEPNDRHYSLETEAAMKRLSAEELSRLLDGEGDGLVPVVEKKVIDVLDLAAKKRGRGP